MRPGASVLGLVDQLALGDPGHHAAQALAHGLRPILVVNKIDRPEERAEEVVNEVFDLLVELGANDTQLEFPVIYASAKQGVASLVYGGEMKDLTPVLDTILAHAPAPMVDETAPLQFQAVTLGYDSFVGRLVIGRVMRGRMQRGMPAIRVREDGGTDAFRITKLFGTRGIQRVEIEEARAGDIVIVAGVETIDVGDTVCEPGKAEALPRIVGWFQRPEGQSVVEFRRISLKNGKIALQGVDVPSVSGDFLLGIDGSFKGGDIRFTDSTLKATLTPNETDLEVALSGRAWKPPSACGRWCRASPASRAASTARATRGPWSIASSRCSRVAGSAIR